MQAGAILIDVAQVTLYVFWIFFAGLIFYLRREDKREGYPLESDRTRRRCVHGFPRCRTRRPFCCARRLATLPNHRNDRRDVAAGADRRWPGAPLSRPATRCSTASVPAPGRDREDVPELTMDGHPVIVPLRLAHGTFCRAARSRSARHDGHRRRPRDRPAWCTDSGSIAPSRRSAISRSRSTPSARREARAAADAVRAHQSPAAASRSQRILGASSPTCRRPRADQVTKLEEDRIAAILAAVRSMRRPQTGAAAVKQDFAPVRRTARRRCRHGERCSGRASRIGGFALRVVPCPGVAIYFAALLVWRLGRTVATAAPPPTLSIAALWLIAPAVSAHRGVGGAGLAVRARRQLTPSPASGCCCSSASRCR